MKKYDPNKAPDPDEWLALPEDTRVLLVKRFHRKHGEYGESLQAHALFHTIVENQLAMKLGPAVSACERLMREGLSRHDAVHAIGSALSDQIWHILRGDPSGGDVDNTKYFAKLDSLTKESWFADYGNAD